MSETGFFAQKRNSPTSLGLVILLHGALIGAVVLIKSPAFIRLVDPTTTVRLIPIDTDPPPEVPPPPRDQPRLPTERVDQVRTEVETQPTGPIFDAGPPTHFAENTAATGIADIPQLPPEPRVPVRHAAQVDPRSQLQPPYPASELRAQRDGRVQVRVTIGPDGRVIDIDLVSATSDAFWRVTREQALRSWRFRPATEDGRPVQETRVMSLVFRITDQG